MIYTKIPGENKRLIIMLHGTGGDEFSLVPLAKVIDPDATLVGVRGNVEEQGMTRYFKRYPDGTFDEKDLAKETKLLYEGIAHMLEQEGLQDYDVSIIGYSNGANIAQNLLKEYTMDVSTVVLFHPAAVRLAVPFKQQQDLQVMATYGAGDPYTNADDFTHLLQELETAGVAVTAYEHEHGHQLVEEEVFLARKIITGVE